MRVFTAALAVSLVVPLSTLSAQQQQPLPVGERVRVSQCHSELLNSGRRRDVCERSVGTLSALSANTIAVADGADGLVFALDSVSSLEVSRGKSSQFGKGLLIGLVIGGGGGAVVGAMAAASGSFCIDTCLDAGAGAAMGAIMGILPGLVVGGVVGALIKTDRWEEAPLDRLRVSFAPRRDGFAFGMRVAF